MVGCGVSSMEAAMSDLRAAVAQAIADLDAEHRQCGGYGPKQVRESCVICQPKDGGWPCVTRQVADDLRAALGELAMTVEGGDEPAPSRGLACLCGHAEALHVDCACPYHVEYGPCSLVACGCRRFEATQ